MQGTIVACDTASGSDLVFVSHARALDRQPRARAGKRQVLTTQLTLALLGAAGDRLRPHALIAAHGRPFALGPLRLELFASGYMPGAASLLCEVDGRRLVYAGPVGWVPAGGAGGAEPGPAARPAHALCVDATFGASRFSFPDPASALAEVGRFVTDALAAGRPPIVLVEPLAALEVGAALAAAGVPARAHRNIMQAAAAHRAAGVGAPILQRFDGRLRAGEALLWPPQARQAARLGGLDAPAVVLASPLAADPEVVADARAERGVTLGRAADFAGLLRYIDATGAAEVALVHAPSDELAATLRARGVDAYPLGPPRQIALFAATRAAPAA